MVALITIAIAQTGFTLLVVYLRLQSVQRAVMRPPKNYVKTLVNGIRSGDMKFGLAWWKVGAVRRDLMLRALKPACFSNEGDASLADSLLKDNEKDNILSSLEGTNKNQERESRILFGFFHPYCNAGGGGEKVLWKAVETTLDFDLRNVAVIYTGDLDVTGEHILDNVIKRFDYKLDKDRIVFIFLKKRNLVDSKSWPHLTLLGQAFGSVVLTLEAILKCPPDVWCDTMGYPFSYPWVWHLLRIPIITYTHYPVMSTDMLKKLKNQRQNLKSLVKYCYWKLFMKYYQHIGSYVTVAITNSTWTNNHIKDIWGQCSSHIIFPPCSTEKLLQNDSKRERKNQAIVLAQFRSEKRHTLIIKAYSDYLSKTKNSNIPKLIFIGSTRSETDRSYVKGLKRLALDELNIPEEKFEIMTDLPYDQIKEMLWTSTYGINAMWNEHFGIAVVEYLVGGLIPIVHGSAGPLFDIVIDDVGFFFLDSSDPDYAEKKEVLGFGSLADAFENAASLNNLEKKRLSDTAVRIALTKFSDDRFNEKWIDVVLSVVNKKSN